MNPKENTFVIPYLGGELIHKCLETMYKHNPDNFYCFIVDQSIEGLDPKLRDKYKNLMVIRTAKSDIHTTGNLGHSQATNLGIQLCQTPYVTMLNDDVEFIDKRWWQGILDTFKKVKEVSPTRPAIMVNAASVKLPDWSVGRPKGDDHYIIPYKENYTDEDWDSLVNEKHYVNEHLTITPGSVIDGINLYCTVADTKKLLEIGMIDDFWYPGSFNDYDICCRASMFGYRSVGTTLSWVFHHWSKTFENAEQMQMLVQDELKHINEREKWGDRFDLWGVKCTQKGCDKIMHTDDGIKATCPVHPDEVYAIPETTVDPL
jgi:GT2 family glycosyltransferase